MTQGNQSKMDSLLARFNISQRNLIENLVSILAISLALTIFICLLVVVTKFFSHRFSPKILLLVKTIKSKLMFNSILRYTLQQFFRLTLATFFNIRLAILASISALSLLLAVPTLLALISFTIFSNIFMKRNEHRLNEKSF